MVDETKAQAVAVCVRQGRACVAWRSEQNKSEQRQEHQASAHQRLPRSCLLDISVPRFALALKSRVTPLHIVVQSRGAVATLLKPDKL